MPELLDFCYMAEAECCEARILWACSWLLCGRMHCCWAHVEVFGHACLLSTTLVLLCYMLYFVQIILQILTICINICLISHLSYCLALCCNSPADCSYKGHPDSGSDPSRAVVKISCAYSRFSNLIPFSPSGLRDPSVQCTVYKMIRKSNGITV